MNLAHRCSACCFVKMCKSEELLFFIPNIARSQITWIKADAIKGETAPRHQMPNKCLIQHRHYRLALKPWLRPPELHSGLLYSRTFQYAKQLHHPPLSPLSREVQTFHLRLALPPSDTDCIQKTWRRFGNEPLSMKMRPAVVGPD